VNASAMIAKSVISETAFKKGRRYQQQFCFSSFDSKRGVWVFLVAFGFSFLEHFCEFLPPSNPSEQKSHLDSR
jgi:hypothetical protein